MLEVIGAGDPSYRGQDWGDVWAASSDYTARADEIKRMIEQRKGSGQRPQLDESEYAMPLWTQILATGKRSFVAYWRTPQYAAVSHTFFSFLLFGR